MRLIGMFVCVCGVHVVAAAQTKMREDMFILKVHGARDQREVQHHEHDKNEEERVFFFHGVQSVADAVQL